jgi:Domain of unknown function (DUF4397)
MRSLMKPLFLLLALVSVSIFLISCNSNSSVQARFVNAIYNTSTYNGSVDVEFSGTKEFTNVTFPNASASTYKAVPGGSVPVELLEYNSTTVVFGPSNETFNGGTDYTMVASGQAGGSGNLVILGVYPDSNGAPATGTVNFRVINASDVAQSIDVYIQQTPFTGTLGQNGVTPDFTINQNSTSTYKNFPWNSDGQGWSIYVTPASNPGLIYLNGFNTGNFGGTGTDAIRTIVLTNDSNAVGTLSSQPLVLTDLN